MKTMVCVLVWLLAAVTTFSQTFEGSRLQREPDSTHFRKDLYIPYATPAMPRKQQWLRAARVPVALATLSLLSYTDNETLDRIEVKELRDRAIPTFRHHIDDYLQYAPMPAVYGLNLAGIKGKNDFANRTALLVKSGLFVAVITFPLKKITAVPRPDTGERNSFPSGHTATAFAVATFMAKEYGHISKWYSVGAYSVATGVGVMRMMNNRHWVSDVLAGAAVGILSTNIAYLTHQYKWGHHKHNRSRTLVVPSYDDQTGMLSVVHILR